MTGAHHSSSTDATSGSDEPRRRSVYLDTFEHTNPIPAACSIGGLVMTGNINGADPKTGQMPASIEVQTRNMFQHLEATMRSAGGTCDDIVKVTVRLADPSNREHLNREWLALFPDPTSRPVRETLGGTTRSDILVQCSIVALMAGHDSTSNPTP